MAMVMEESGGLSVQMDLAPVAGSALDPLDGDNHFHTTNPDNDPFRTTLAQTMNPHAQLFTRIAIAELHHGNMVYKEDEWEATLLVLDFRFHGGTEKRRYKYANIQVEFFDKGNVRSYDPVVVKLAPDGRHAVDKVAYDQRTRLGVSSGITVPAAVMNGDARIEWERERTKEHSFEVEVSGTSYLSRGRNGAENAVRWTMQENESSKKGIPSLLQTAVLVKRPKGGRPFEMRLHVDSSVDLASMVNRLVRVATDKDPRIDSVVIKPHEVQMANRGVVKISDDDRQNMEDLDLGCFFRVLKSNEDDLTPVAVTKASTGTTQEGATNTKTTSTALVSTEPSAMTTTTTTTMNPGIGNKEGTTGHGQVAAAVLGSVLRATFAEEEKEQPAAPVAPSVYGDVPPLARVDPAQPEPTPNHEVLVAVKSAAISTDTASTSVFVPASLLTDIIAISGKTAEMAAHAAKTAAEAAKAAAQAAEAVTKLSQSILQAAEKLSTT